MRRIIRAFETKKEILSVQPWGNGHINSTFLVTFASGERCILQRINTSVFRDVDGLMDNIVKVTSFLQEKLRAEDGDEKRGTLTVIRTADGRPYWTDEAGQAWRLYRNIDHVMTYEKAENSEMMYQCGLLIGRFQTLLADFPVSELKETIPDFHNTARRYQDFERAVSLDRCGRAESAAAEITFVRERRSELSVFMELENKGKLPLRVTHNDTKLSNILFDVETHKAVCLCDLDTVMPGFAPFDFGDAIRSGAVAVSEDETDFGRVSLSLPLYRACLKGFLRGAGERLTKEEIALLPMGSKLMTLELGMRSLTDYLAGDVYFKTAYELQNLNRCQRQFALAADMEKKWPEMEPMACLDADYS